MSSPKGPSSPTGTSTAASASKRPFGAGQVQPAALRRRAAALGETAEKPQSSRAAGAGGSNATMLRLYSSDNDSATGLKVDPVVILGLSVVFVLSVVALHLINKATRFILKS